MLIFKLQKSMQLKFKIFSLVIFFVYVFIALTFSASQLGYVEVFVVKNLVTGKPLGLVVYGETKQKLYMGISYYPYNTKDVVNQGTHKLYQLGVGEFINSFKIDKKFLGGSFEVALWQKKVLRKFCKIKNCKWCKRNGYHMEGLIAYKSGYIK